VTPKIPYTGSKNGSGVAQRIISEMPVHRVYVEPFAGTGIVGRMKRAAALTIFIDSDASAPIFSLLPPSPFSELLQVMNNNAAVPAPHAICGDAISSLKALSPVMDSSWLIYADPPYLASVRSNSRDYYRNEMKDVDDHRRLLAVLRDLPAAVMISGYDSPLYRRELKGWRSIVIPTVKRNGARVEEIVWMNFDEPIVFHDTRFLGGNFRERFRIKRRKDRWRARLLKMKKTDRMAIIDAISDITSIPVHHRRF